MIQTQDNSTTKAIPENQLVTENIMGFVGYNDTQVSIRSRFAQQQGDYFLHYMLQKVFAINLFDLKHDSDNESVFDFLIYLFPAFLKRALRQGIYKEYQTRNYNDANVRGRIDMPLIIMSPNSSGIPLNTSRAIHITEISSETTTRPRKRLA